MRKFIQQGVGSYRVSRDEFVLLVYK